MLVQSVARLHADTYAGYHPDSPGQFPNTNTDARPYYVQYTSNRDGVSDYYCLSFPRDFDPNKTYPIWFKFKPRDGSGWNIKKPTFAYNFCDAHQVIYIGCNERGIGDAMFGDNPNLNPVTAQNIPADMVELLNQLCYHFKINYVASFGGSMGGYSALRFMTHLPEDYVGVATPSCPALWYRDWLYPGSDLISRFVAKGFFNEKYVLIMHGTADNEVPIDTSSRRLTSVVPDRRWWQLVEVPGAGHEEFFMIEDPTRPFPFDDEWGKSKAVPDIWDRIYAWEAAHPNYVQRRLRPIPGWIPPTHWYLPQAVIQASVAPRGSVAMADVVQKYTVLVGASVGDGWGLADYFQRADGTAYVSNESTPIYQFDKQDRLRELIRRTGPTRPTAIILKECAAYFSGANETDAGPLATAENMVSGWVHELHAAGIVPILTTVVPINSRAGDNWQDRLRGIQAYNDWVRQYTRAHRIALLDLESAVRVSAQDRSLRLDLDDGDGLHLTPFAYTNCLNPIFLPALLATYNQANEVPEALAGTDRIIYDRDTNGVEQVTLDGTASSDPDGTITNYIWSLHGAKIATGATASVALSLAIHQITLIVTDNLGTTNSDTVTVSVLPADFDPPKPISDLRVFPGNKKLLAQWTESLSPDVAGYRIYLNGEAYANTGVTNRYTLLNLTNGATYTVGVAALDAGLNQSPRLEATGIPVGPPPEALVTNIFQKGLLPNASYGQCLDSVFRDNTPGAGFAAHAFGKAPAFSTRSQNWGGTAALWFDLSSLPGQVVVEQAFLRIWFEPDEFDAAGTLSLQRLLDPDGTGMWQENPLVNEAAYDAPGLSVEANQMGSANFKRVGVPWSGTAEVFTGVLHPTLTRSVAHPAGRAGWIEFNVTEDIQVFLADSRYNLGWALSTSADDTLRGEVYTADYPEAAKRPQLQIIYAREISSQRLRLLSLTNRQPRIEITGAPGQAFVLQHSTNLPTWTPLMTNQMTGNSFLFIDAANPRADRNFYRTQLPQ